MKPPAPTTPRQVFEAFKYYDETEGLAGLVKRYAWDGVGPHQIYGAILGRFPESIAPLKKGPEYLAENHFVQALYSEEFQRQVMKRVAEAFPEKRRLVHVHIYKTAGNDLRKNLSNKFPHIHHNDMNPGEVGKIELFRRIKDFSTKIEKTDLILLAGHLTLEWYLTNNLCRYGDRVFSVVREPRQIVISYINFIIRRFMEDPNCESHDTKNWLQTIGLDSPPKVRNKRSIRSIASRILCNREILFPNFLASYLGCGTAASAFEFMARTNIEITEIGIYNKWLRETWGINSRTHENQSPAYINIDDLSRRQRSYIDELCDQDIMIYDRIMTAMDKGKSVRVFGSELL